MAKGNRQQLTDSEAQAMIPVVVPIEQSIATIRDQLLPDIECQQENVKLVAIIRNTSQYQQASYCISRLGEAQKKVEQALEPFIRPRKQELDAFYALRRELMDPLVGLEQTVKGAMQTWKLQELAGQRKKEQEERDKVQEAERLRQQAAAASTGPFTRREMLAEAEELEAEVEVQKLMPAVIPVKAYGSSSSVKQKPVVTDLMKLVDEVSEGNAPADLLEVNQQKLNAWWKADPARVRKWQGVEIKDDVTIAKRGGR